MKWGNILVFASYLLLSAAFTWPAAQLSPEVLPTRHFDIYPMVWLLERSPYTFPDMVHAYSAWPYGESLSRLDSYVLLWLGWLNQGMIPGVTLVSLLAWWGPAISAYVAEYAARSCLHVPRPYSWIAGAGYAFSGIASNALLEGHVYHLMDPWLPLLFIALWRGTGPWGRASHGFLIGLSWALCQFTTAYLGICGIILIGVLLLRSPWAMRMLLPGILVTAVPSGLYYVYLFSQESLWKSSAPFNPELIMQGGSSTLAGLLAWTPETDLVWHSLAAPLGFCTFWLFLLAPVLLQDRHGWRAIWLCAFAALLMSFGASFRMYPEGPGLTSPLALLSSVEALRFFRFPMRLLWIYSLLGSLIASRVAAEIGQSRWSVAGMLLAVVVDALAVTGAPLRLRAAIATVPSAYQAAPKDRAILDIYGTILTHSSDEMSMRTRVIGCYYQTVHQRPIFEVCIGTGDNTPREHLSEWLVSELLNPQSDKAQVLKHLADVGTGALALHTDTIRPADAESLSQALTNLLGPATVSTDGGEHLQVYVMPEATVDIELYRSSIKSLYVP